MTESRLTLEVGSSAPPWTTNLKLALVSESIEVSSTTGPLRLRRASLNL